MFLALVSGDSLFRTWKTRPTLSLSATRLASTTLTSAEAWLLAATPLRWVKGKVNQPSLLSPDIPISFVTHSNFRTRMFATASRPARRTRTVPLSPRSSATPTVSAAAAPPLARLVIFHIIYVMFPGESPSSSWQFPSVISRFCRITVFLFLLHRHFVTPPVQRQRRCHLGHWHLQELQLRVARRHHHPQHCCCCPCPSLLSWNINIVFIGKCTFGKCETWS